MSEVWLITGKSESGDDYGPEVVRQKPTRAELLELAFSWDGDLENPNGVGDYGSEVHMSVQLVRVEEELFAK